MTLSTRWRFGALTALAALLCLAPKAVSVASARVRPVAAETRVSKLEILAPTLPSPPREGRQVSIRLRSGTLVAAVSWTVDVETAHDVLRGRIEYRPDADQPGRCSSIRFIQAARLLRNGGGEYEWQGFEEHRNLLRTNSRTDVGIQGGYFVDHKASNCAPATPCSPYFRDHWANPSDSGDGYRTWWGAAPASLVDYPFGWDTMEEIALESCARCVETGEFLGCVEWGGRWPMQGDRVVSPIRVRGTPSRTFLAAFRNFENFYGLETRRAGVVER